MKRFGVRREAKFDLINIEFELENKKKKLIKEIDMLLQR